MSTKPQSPKSKPQPEPLSLEQKLQQDQASRDRWNQVAASPDLSLPAALAARQLARSYGAAVTLGQKALLNQQAENDQDSQSQLMRLLGINPLLQDPPPQSDQETPPS